jgi:NTP pyrophosphatase (non-canonical NTP hydrolase)
MHLKEIMGIQKEFDLNHEGKIPFYSEISENNLNKLEHLLVCLMGEIGEASNITKKIVRGDFDLESKKSELEEEFVDTFIYLIKICNQLNIDLEKWFIKKLNINRKKFEHYEK